MGKNLIKILCKIAIDKLLRMWYNGKFGESRTPSGRQKQQQKDEDTNPHLYLCPHTRMEFLNRTTRLLHQDDEPRR